MRRVEMIVGGIVMAPKLLLWVVTFCALWACAWCLMQCMELWAWMFGDE